MALYLNRLFPRAESRILITQTVHVTYRLIAELPIAVHFPSLSFRLEGHYPDPKDTRAETSMWDLVVRSMNEKTGIVVARTWNKEAFHRIFSEGVILRYPCRTETIFARMVRDGTAERLEGPHSELYFMGNPRPKASRALFCG